MILLPPGASSLFRPAVISLAILTILLSGVRLTDVKLRASTAAVTNTAGDDVRTQKPRATQLQRAPGGSPDIEQSVIVPPARPTFPRPVSSLEPEARPAGAFAHFGAVARSARWRVLGGHGRHGAG